MIDIDGYLKILCMNIGFIWGIICGYILFNTNIDPNHLNNIDDDLDQYSDDHLSDHLSDHLIDHMSEHNSDYMKNYKYTADIWSRIEKTLTILNDDIHHIRKRSYVMEKKIDHICKCIDYQISVSIDE